MTNTASPRDLLRQTLIADESLRRLPYLDCCGKYWRLCTCAQKGKLTIGVGRNLDDVGISVPEANVLLDDDIDAAVAQCSQAFGWFATLDSVRQGVLVNMTFNLGIDGLKQFTQTLAAIERRDYPGAAKLMLQSKWADEVGGRAARLAARMETGAYA